MGEGLSNDSAEDVDVKTFDIHDRAYPRHTLSCVPPLGGISDESLRAAIHAVVADGLRIQIAGTPVRMVAFDMEWTTDHRARRERPTALIQMSGRTKTLIIKLKQIQPNSWENHVLAAPVAELLRDPTIVKFGVGISGDAQKITRDRFFDPDGARIFLTAYLEIFDVAMAVDPQARHELPPRHFSLQRFVARYLDQYLPKSLAVTCSNWGKIKLNSRQITCQLAVPSRLFFISTVLRLTP